MAFAQVITALVFALALAKVHPSACQLVKGKVTCHDCTDDNYDFSGIKVLVKCEGVKKLAVATTEDNGSFKADLPLDHKKLHNPSSLNCHAKLLGGPKYIYASKKNQISQIVKGKNEGMNSFTISTPLSFFQSCPQQTKQHCKVSNTLDSSKTFYFPLPPEWGLAPTSFYFPFFPIIGIP